jgi:hypothetical protein
MQFSPSQNLLIAEPHYLILEYVMYGKLLAYLRDHRTRQDFYNFSEDSAALTSRDLTVFGYCVARGMEYLASKKVSRFTFTSFAQPTRHSTKQCSGWACEELPWSFRGACDSRLK